MGFREASGWPRRSSSPRSTGSSLRAARPRGGASWTGCSSPQGPRRETIWPGTTGRCAAQRAPREGQVGRVPAPPMSSPRGPRSWSGRARSLRRKRREALAAWRELFLDLAREAGRGIRRRFSRVTCLMATPKRISGGLRTAPAGRERRRVTLWPARTGTTCPGPATAGRWRPAPPPGRSSGPSPSPSWRSGTPSPGQPVRLPCSAWTISTPALSAGWAEAFFDALPEGATALLTTASDPARWRRRAPAIVEMRAGRRWRASPARRQDGKTRS